MSKQNELLKLYNKQRKRIRAAIRRERSRGYVFVDEPIPQKPKKITAGSIRRLEKITPEVLRKKAEYFVDVETGEVLPKPKTPPKLPKKKKAEPPTGVTYAPAWEDVVIANIELLIARMRDNRLREKFTEFVRQSIAEVGKLATAIAFTEAEKNDNIEEIVAHSVDDRLDIYLMNFELSVPVNPDLWAEIQGINANTESAEGFGL